MANIPPSAFRHPPQPPPRRCSDGSDSNMLSEEGNTLILRGKSLYLNSRTRPYYVRRCKKGRATSIESLPDELLFDILVRLPADYLYDTARVVCRKWYHIIYSYAFVNTQIHQSTYGLLLSSLPLCRSHPIYVTETQGRIEASKLSYKYRTELLASCNGLAVDLHHDNEDLSLHLINPATKQPFPLPPSVSIDCDDARPYLCGIAYSAASMEYKVILPYLVRGRLPFPQCVGLDILTVGVDKSWRHVPVHHLHEHVKPLVCQSPLTTEGFLHWGKGSYALTLNVETEIISVSEVPLPQAYHQYKDHDYYYVSTGRYLSLLVRRGNFLWEVWEMKPENGEWRKSLPDIKLEAQKSRLQQFASEPDQVLEPLGWVNYPKILAFRFLCACCTCIFYNLETHEIDSLKLPESYILCKAFAHRNNLFLNPEKVVVLSLEFELFSDDNFCEMAYF